MEFVTPNITNLLTTAVGFILFVWVLAKFAWGPVLGLLDDRRRLAVRANGEDECFIGPFHRRSSRST